MIRPTKKILQNNLKEFFAYRIFDRGVRYYQDDLVRSLKVFPTKYANKIVIRGSIEGSDYYDAGFVFDFETNQFDQLNCDCPYYDSCKHLAALGLEFIDAYMNFAGIFELSNDMEVLSREVVSSVNIREKAQNYEDDDSAIDVDNQRVVEAEFEKIDDKYTNKAKPIQKKIENFNPDDYHLILRFEYGLSVNLRKNSDRYSYPAFRDDVAEVLRKYRNGLTAAQKGLIEILEKKEYSYDYDKRFDYANLFEFIRDSKIRIYRDKRYSNNQMFFEKSKNKLNAELVLKNDYNDYLDCNEHAFIFKLDPKYSYKKNQWLFYGSNAIVYIKDINIFIYPTSSILTNVMHRIDFEQRFDYEMKKMIKICHTELIEDEIVNLNKIIKDGQKYLDLKTDLIPDYNIKNFKRADPCFVADYSFDENVLSVKPSIDYGSRKQDISETVYCNKQKGKQRKFYRRPWKNQVKYAIEINGRDIFYSPVNERQEIKFFKELYGPDKFGFTKTLKCNLKTQNQIFNFLNNNWDSLKKFANQKKYQIYFVRDELNFTQENFKADFHVDLNADNDWLGFDVNCYCGQDKISLEDLKKYVANKKEFIKTANGNLLKVVNSKELERFIFMLESFYERESGGFEGRLYHAPELKNIFTSSKYYNAKVEKSFDKFIKEVKSGKPVRKIRLATKYNKILRDYQKQGISWFYFLRKYRFAGILADDMGLGKTLQTLILLEKERIAGKPSIVICPKTLLYNWQLEVKKFIPNLKTLVIDGLAKERKLLVEEVKKYDLVITGYATMQKDAMIYDKKKIKFNYCVLDEAQFIKNHTTKNAQIVKKINADYRLALTGTPLENSVSEIWSIFDFLMPGFLGSYNLFVKKFQNPIMKKSNQLALENLRKKVECFMLRRTKREVLKELPPKIEQVSHCQLGKDQNILYQEVLANVKKDIFETVKEKGFNKSRIHILAGLTKLRQVCNHPVLLLKDKKYNKYDSAKLNMFLELIDEIVENKRRVLVFSQFTKMLDILAMELDRKKIGYNYLSGKTKNRQALIQDFNENGIPVFLISLRAGGVGLNLTSADNVIIFDPWWNPSVENQAIDRTHRIGQKNSVNVYRLIVTGTIEEQIVKLQEKKKFLFDNLVGESKDLFQKLTWDDIKKLFG